MKNIINLFLIGFCFYSSAYAQNTFPSSGNVGIGTTNPQTALDVNGGIRTQGESQFSLGDYYDPHSGVGYAIKVGSRGIAVNGNSTFLNGNVGIGTTDTRGYKLGVAGNIIAESVTVKLQSQWPDYVFKANYNLPSLDQVKAYVDLNSHLPDMPSEAEVAKDGVNLGEINKLLLKKVEELTLYTIQQQEEQKSLRLMLLKQQKQINKLKKNKIALPKSK